MPRVKHWPPHDGEPKPLAFVGFKAGMTHLFLVDNIPGSPTFGSEVISPATVVDTPPMPVVGVVLYEKSENGSLRQIGKGFAENVPEDFQRLIANFRSKPGKIEKIGPLAERAAEVRTILMTQPRLASVPSKKPRLLEVKVGGKNTKECFGYAVEKLGSELKVSDAFSPGEFADVIAVTRGKGFQGVVKRHHVGILPRKSRKTRRGVAAIGAWHPTYVPYTVPRAGQMGYHRRTEFGKRVLVLEEDGSKITPKGGFAHYGAVKGPCLLLSGTTPGVPKRPVILRSPARPPSTPLPEPEIVQVKV